MNILVLHGPNLNLLGKRKPEIYGSRTLEDLDDMIIDYAKKLGIETESFQSNHEGALIDMIQERYEEIDGIVINAGALTHYSYALRDAIESVGVKTVEVHISDIYNREEFRAKSVLSEVCEKTIVGKGFDGYLEAIDVLIELNKNWKYKLLL